MMTDTQQAPIESKDDTPQAPSQQSPGAMLRTQRESAGVSQQAVSEALHLTVHYIKALENDEYGKLPGLTFVKGYFRAYSRFLGMDVNEVLACYERYLVDKGLQVENNDFVPSSRRGRSDQSLVWALVAGTILVIALAAGWWFFGREFDARSAAAPVSTSSQQQTIPATASANAAVNAAAPSAFTATPAATTAVPPQQQATEPETVLEPADAGAAIINATLEARQEAEALALEEGADLVQSADASAASQQVAGAIESAATNTDAAPDVAANGASVQSAQEEPAPPAAVAQEIEQAVADAAGASDAIAARTGDLEYVTGEDGRRVITHHGDGSDRLELNLNGSSWAEVKNAQGDNIFNNMLRQGDQLVIQGEAPFAVLLGDARQVQASFNAQRVDLSTLIRNDNTARFELGPSGVSTPAFTTSQASAVE